MKSLYRAAIFYLVMGLAAGLFYREFTRANDFPEGQFTQLGVAHTHLLALGFMMFLIFLVVDKVFGVSRNKKLFNSFFWFYNIGVVLTVGMLIWHGSLTVLGEESTAMIVGIAGIGHILITIGLVLFVVALGRALKEPANSSTPAPVSA
ncbi:DUF2871 domain-containing protein [Corynebacterium aurimucosum]|uniref:DUF2871 domain-containing protein n=1 Tax=Corynebacterium aurimucosum TaxID=169292 RepID=UPI00191FE869|nr:DUF2871 domain-containing protein [Corynebacterium aurimucosum]QQU94752.1 DUF2871 domain-containing protein [Corynebacterium aurimucosum]UTA72340.1 DUF2871 domain-containing protein [Corynebacterium aurimucosum]WJY70663.1 hypothetical protein CAURIM_07785 [Corynebacterium aurimucosum]